MTSDSVLGESEMAAALATSGLLSDADLETPPRITEREAQDIMEQIGGLPDDSWTSSFHEELPLFPKPAESVSVPEAGGEEGEGAFLPRQGGRGPSPIYPLSIIQEASALDDETMPWDGPQFEASLAAQASLGEEFGVGGAELLAELKADEALAVSAVEEEQVPTPGHAHLGLAAVAASEGWTPPPSEETSQLHPSSLFGGRTEPLGDSLHSQPRHAVPSRPAFGQPIPNSPGNSLGAKSQAASQRPSLISQASQRPSLVDELPSSRLSAASYQTTLGPPAALAAPPEPIMEELTATMDGLHLEARNEYDEALMSTPMVAGLSRPSIPLSAVPVGAKTPRGGIDGSYLGGPPLPLHPTIGEESGEHALMGETTAFVQRAIEEAPTDAASTALFEAINATKHHSSPIRNPAHPLPSSIQQAASAHSHSHRSQSQSASTDVPEAGGGETKSAQHSSSASALSTPRLDSPAPIKLRSNVMRLNFGPMMVGTTRSEEWQLRNGDSERMGMLEFRLRHSSCPLSLWSLDVEEQGLVALNGGKAAIAPGATLTCCLSLSPNAAVPIQARLAISIRPVSEFGAPAQTHVLQVAASPVPAKPQPLRSFNADVLKTRSYPPHPKMPPPTVVTDENTPPSSHLKEGNLEGVSVRQAMVCLGIVPIGSAKTVHVSLDNASESPMLVELYLQEPRVDVRLGKARLEAKSCESLVPITFAPVCPGPLHLSVGICPPGTPTKAVQSFQLSGFAV